jgi:hypothetical protein
VPEGSIPLSVLVATRDGWPAIASRIEPLLDQVRDVGGELIVVDSSGGEAPDLGPSVQWLTQPASMTVFQAREVAYKASRGEIVASTEDHCLVMPGWCRRILDLHAAHPEAAAIGGALENGSTDNLLDWAAFIVTQAPALAPLPSGAVSRTTGAANVSLKRRAVERLPSHDGFGTIELFDLDEVVPAGEVLLRDDSLVVTHHQSMGFVGTSVVEYHNGRTLGGFRRRYMDRRDWARVATAGVLPLYRSIRMVSLASRKQVPRRSLIAAIPWIVWLEYCTGAGQLLGYATGPGDSPGKLH